MKLQGMFDPTIKGLPAEALWQRFRKKATD